MIKTYCDFCGQELTSENTPGQWPLIELRGKRVCVSHTPSRAIYKPEEHGTSSHARADICRSCTRELWRKSADALLGSDQ